MASCAALVATDRGLGRARQGAGLAPHGRSTLGGVHDCRDFNVTIRGRIATVTHDPTGNIFVFPIFAQPPYIAAVELGSFPLADSTLDGLTWAAREVVINQVRATCLVS
jgi:hypothetical protein